MVGYTCQEVLILFKRFIKTIDLMRKPGACCVELLLEIIFLLCLQFLESRNYSKINLQDAKKKQHRVNEMQKIETINAAVRARVTEKCKCVNRRSQQDGLSMKKKFVLTQEQKPLGHLRVDDLTTALKKSCK